MRRLLRLAVLMACSAPACFAQSNPRFGVGARVSTLGWGIEGAVAVTQKSNLRGGFNVLGYGQPFRREDGIDYSGSLKLLSIETHYDWFLFRGLRVSPGLLVYNGNRIEGLANVRGGESSFTIGSNTYYTSFSSRTYELSGPFRVDFSKSKISPMITAGVGNLVRRTGKRFSITREGGIVFEGSPRAQLDLHGSLGSTPVGPFFSASSPQVQADLRAEESKINTGAPPYDTVHKVIKYYPVLSYGVGFRIK